jgi:hypothetical protein
VCVYCMLNQWVMVIILSVVVMFKLNFILVMHVL